MTLSVKRKAGQTNAIVKCKHRACEPQTKKLNGPVWQGDRNNGWSGRGEKKLGRIRERVEKKVKEKIVKLSGLSVENVSRLREALWESEAKLKLIADYSVSAEIFRNEKGKIVYVSPGFEKIFGYRVEDLDNELSLNGFPHTHRNLTPMSRCGIVPSMPIWPTLFQVTSSIWPELFASRCEKADLNNRCCVRSLNMQNCLCDMLRKLFNGQ